MVRDNLMSRCNRKKANFGLRRFLFEVNFEQPEHRKHPYYCTLNCSRVNLVSLVKVDSHITESNKTCGTLQSNAPKIS